MDRFKHILLHTILPAAVILTAVLVITAAAYGVHRAVKVDPGEPYTFEEVPAEDLEEVYALEEARLQHERVKAEREAGEAEARAEKRTMANYRAMLRLLADPEPDSFAIASMLVDPYTVGISLSGLRTVKTDDGLYHILAQDITESGTQGRLIASKKADANVNFAVSLAKDTVDSLLTKRFVAVVLKDGEYVPVSRGAYILNPGVCADATHPRNDHGKKGILPAAAYIRSDSVAALRADQSIYNVLLGSLCSGSGYNYTWNGQTYSFSYDILSQLDIVVNRLASQGTQITFVLLNNAAGNASLIDPRARGGSAHYYAFNTAEKGGMDKMAAAVAMLAGRYSAVDNWVIGNEINARGDWYYMSTSGLEEFSQAYANAFRVLYNTILSRNANARVYISIDQQWNRSINTAKYYSGRSFLNAFNRAVSAEGNIPWDVAVHPYNYPLSAATAWSTGNNVFHSIETPMLTMANIDVLTDFLCAPDMINDDGTVRSVLCSEVGYTSQKGEGLQAASVVYGYLQAVNNQHIDGFILSRELDDAGEAAQGLSLGLISSGGTRKLAWHWYMEIDGDNAQRIIAEAAAVIGVEDIRTLLTPR